MTGSAEDRLMIRGMLLTASLLLAFALAYFVYSSLDTLNNAVFSIDFLPYHLAARLLAQGNLNPLTDYADTGGFFATSGPFLDYFHQYFFPQSSYATRWVYLPAYLWIFRPLAGFEFPTAARIWLAVNVVMTAGCFWLLWSARRIPSLDGSLKIWRLAWFAFLVFTFQPVLSNLWHGQVTALIFLVFCLCYWLLHRKQPFAAGLALGLIVPFKFYPLLFVFYFIWRRQWKVVLGALVSCALILGVSLLTVGWQSNLSYFRVVLAEFSSGGNPAFNNQSISGFLMHAFTRGDVFSWLDINIPPTVTALRLAAILVMVGVVIWVMRKPSLGRQVAVGSLDLDLALVVFVMLLASPITWYHYYMWLLLPLTILFDLLFLSTRIQNRQILWFALAYALVVFQGIATLQFLAPDALQDAWLLRVMLSQSFVGAVLLLVLTVKSRLDISLEQIQPYDQQQMEAIDENN